MSLELRIVHLFLFICTSGNASVQLNHTKRQNSVYLAIENLNNNNL